tara:strand:+ start:845 stop:1315 length:471 start_codon:yes stop_codon:yes gene_type:complete
MRLNKYEAKEYRAARMEQVLSGKGLYIYENNSDGDLILPRPTASGMRAVPARQQFQGDDYYMQMVKTNQLRLIKQLVSPQEQEMAEQKKLNEGTVAQDQLLLDQPATFTNEGQVEFVAPQAGLPPLTEQVPPTVVEGQDVLLTEEPLDGLEIDIED